MKKNQMKFRMDKDPTYATKVMSTLRSFYQSEEKRNMRRTLQHDN